MVSRKTFSKSAYLIYKQCPRYFWYYINNRESIPEPDLRTKFNFRLGHIIGDIAKKYFPEGIEVGYEGDFDQNLKRTQLLLEKRFPLYEAGLLFKDDYYDVYSRADVLFPSEFAQNSNILEVQEYKESGLKEKCWDIIEVKSSTGVKDVNLFDVAFQKYCYKNAGLNIKNCFIMYINNQYIRDESIDVKELFTISDVTDAVSKIVPHIKNDLRQMLKVASNENFIYDEIQPEDMVGKFCDSPFNCPLKTKCWEKVSSKSIFNLYAITNKTISRLYARNIKFIDQIPEEFEGMSDKQKIQIGCVKNSDHHINREELRNYLKKIKYPLYFLDFETFSSPVPLICGTRPYQNIPFQFSLHILKNPDGTPTHRSFLSSGDYDPRNELLENLRREFGFGEGVSFGGSVIVYNESFERAILRDLAAHSPEHASWIYMIMANIVDLYEPFKNFHYYNRLQNGSASVKKVLPALTGKSYSNLAITNGDTASISFLEKSRLWKDFIKSGFFNVSENFIQDELDEEEEIKKIRGNLEQYCKLDTEGMLSILKELDSLILK